jgi:predicted nucleic acid-binding protein
VDTSIIIYTVEKFPQYFSALLPLWTSLQAGAIAVFTSELTLIEVLVAPLRDQDRTLVMTFEQFLLATEVQPLPISQHYYR